MEANIIQPDIFIEIDRSKPFDPKLNISKDWTIFKQDTRALFVSKINVSKIVLQNIIKDDKEFISEDKKEEHLKELESSYIFLDAAVAKTLWEEQNKIPEIWKESSEFKYIYFLGTIFKEKSSGNYFILALHWNEDKWEISPARINGPKIITNWYSSDIFVALPLEEFVA